MSRTSPNGSSLNEDEEAPVSISSLRSKFESLAAANNGTLDAGPRSRSGSAVGAGKVNGGRIAGLGIEMGSQSTSNGTLSTPSSRPVTPKPTQPPVPVSAVTSASPADTASASQSAPSSPPLIEKSAPKAKLAPPPVPSKPIITSTPASPVPLSPPKAALNVLERRPSEPVIATSPSSSPRPLSPVLISPRPQRRAAPAVPPKGPSRAASPVPADEDGPAPSVKALRDRFAGGLSADAGPSRILSKSPSLDGSRSPKSTMSRQISAPAVKLTPDTPSTSQFSTSPAQVDPSPLSRRPPPPPISRTASPGPPPQPDRATKPPRPAQSTPSGSGSQSPAMTDSEATPAAPPSLPVRKPTLPTPELTSAPMPPPIPGNKPRPESPARRGNSSDTGPGPPRLPQRNRAHTISRADPAPPPPLPVRQGTLSVGPAPGLPGHSHTMSLPVSPQRSRDIQPDNYQPPPPPMRSSTLSVSSPPRREDSRTSIAVNDDLSSEDEEEGDPVPLSGLSSTAKRALEEHPDSTHANRRPPRFVPDIRMAQPHHIYAFAVFGRHVCTGAHHVRVYDTQMSERPIFIVDLRETGLEFRIKDPRITAMGFRPGSHPKDEGRFLWCGTKDGHLWELDIMTGQVTDTKAGAHGAAVSHVFRYRQNVITLDEGGKMLVHEVPISEVEDAQLPVKLTRTLRVSERFNFARMIGGTLWTASAPSARSTTTAATTAASKGATVRVYEPCAPGSMPPGKTLFTTEWTGAVTAATILPLHPETVYLGHEGGFVSIWSSEEMVCQQVIKISASDILALEGVGERLWAGNRKGQIWVFDVQPKPWVATNIWLAYPEHPVQMLYVDPWSIEHTGRCAVWSTTRDHISAWDGLLSVDWIDTQMTARQAEYCTFRDVKALICSWNIDSAKPTELAGSEANALFLEQLLNSVDSPDIIVFGFQEVIPLTDKKLTAKTLLFGGKTKEAGATADKVSSAYRNWLEKLTYAVRMATPIECNYVKVHSESLVGLFTCVFVKTDQREGLRDVDICTVKRGLGNIYGNKGAIVARMVLDDTSLCFINVHLAAGQSQKAARNADLNAIMEDKAILPASDELPYVHGGDGTAILDHELVFLNGDLNYRIDQRRENVLSNISANDLPYLLEHDQLLKELRTNHTFRLRSFTEPAITFPPTYKYNRGTDTYDSSEKKRIPAWCDRILYCNAGSGNGVEVLGYRRYEATLSDHKPISAGFRLRVKKVDRGLMGVVRGQVGEEWAEREREVLERMNEAFKGLV